MKPKTKLQIEVWKLHQALSKPKEHEGFVKSKHAFYYATHYKNLVCMECNHSWKPAMQFWAEEIIGVTCPSCKKKLKKIETTSGDARRFLVYSVVQAVERFQVVRYFSCWKNMSKNKKPTYHFRALFEEWKDWDKNKRVIIGRTTTWTGDGFTSTPYEVRQATSTGWRSSDYDTYTSDVNCPGSTFIPRFDKYGLKKDFHDCDYRSLLQKLEDNPKVETLLKTKQASLLFHAVHKDNKHYTYWPQIKIMLRHKYKITDAGIWYDYLQLLGEFGKDIRNPKFILPKNLKHAHDEYMAKKEKRLAIERAKKDVIRQEKERAKAEAEEALKNIKAEVFKDFAFQKGKITIVPLIEDADVELEGKTLKHCVHTNSYHKKAGILLMSARIGEERIETLEISLATYKIIQCRGLNNAPTPFHDEIIAIVKQNMGKISKLVEDAKKLKQFDLTSNKLEAA
jgi:hypothetical protein